MSYTGDLASILGKATHTSPRHFSAAFTSNVTITISNASFDVDDDNCHVLFVHYKPNGGVWQTPYVNGVNGVSLAAVDNVITIAGAGTPFASGDSYYVGVSYSDDTIDDDLKVVKMIEQRPPWNRFTVPESIATSLALTNFGTYIDLGFPQDLRGYTDLLVYVNLDIGAATNVRFKSLGQTTDVGGATDEYNLPIEIISPSDVKINRAYLELNEDIDQLIILRVITAGIPYVQLQVDGGVDNGDNPILTSVKVSKVWR